MTRPWPLPLRGRIRVLVLAPPLLLAATLHHLGRARAGDMPGAPPLYYAGYLEEGGLPVDRARTLQVNLWDDATSSDPTALRCFLPPTVTAVDRGRFRVALPTTCEAVVREGGELWVEVIVDSQPLPRSRIGAVPFASRAEAVPWSGVAGLGPGSEWPGVVPWERVAGAPDVAALDRRVGVLEAARPRYTNPGTGKALSLDGDYCGSTAPTSGLVTEGPAVGYAAMKARCENACLSPTAHACTFDELARSAQTGGAGPALAGWYVSGVVGAVGGGTLSDCGGFASSLGTQYGLVFQTGPMPVACSARQPILCCD